MKRSQAILAALILGVAFVVAALTSGTAATPSAFDSGTITTVSNASGYTPVVALPFTPSAVDAEAQSPQAGSATMPYQHVTALIGNGFQVRWTTQTGAVFVGALKYSYIATAGPAPTPTTTAPTTTAAACGGPITITAGGTYNGCYQSNATGTPAVTIATAQPVTLDHAQIIAKGYGLIDSVAGVQLFVTDSKFTQQDPGAVVNHRAIALTKGAASTDIEHNSFTDGDGVWVAAPTNAIFTVPAVTVNYNLATNIGRYPNPKDFGCCVQFLQLSQIKSPAIDIGWNHTQNTPGQSGVEDNINLWNSGGTDATHRSNVHDNLIDGAYPTTVTDKFTGAGINVGDAGDHNNLAHDNTVVSVTNVGIGISGIDNYANNNLLINDGAEATSAFGQAVSAYDPVPTPAGLHTTGNKYNWHRSTTDATQYGCYISTYCGNGTVVTTTEQQARDAWAASVPAGVIIGPRP